MINLHSIQHVVSKQRDFFLTLLMAEQKKKNERA